jgi:predicted O-linked N-acetylglucosamine transferase (SPINDLY family)
VLDTLADRARWAAALVAFANRLVEREDRIGAAVACRAALELTPDATSAHALLAVIAHKDGRPDEALARAWRLVELKPEDADAHCLLGQLLAGSGHRDDARAALEQALQLDPDCGDAHRELGALYAFEKDVARADDHLQRAIMLRPTDIDALRRFGWLLHDTARFERAEAVTRLAVKTAPYDPTVYHLLGCILNRRGRTAEARGALEHALGLAPMFQPGLRALGQLDLAAGDTYHAVGRLRVATELAPDDAEAHHMLAWALHDHHDLEAAEAASRRAVALAPERPGFHAQLVWLLIERGELDAAAGACIALLARHPDDADGLRLMGELHFRHRRFTEAIGWLERAVAHNPKATAAHGRLGTIHQKLERPDLAEPALRAAIESDPDFAAGYRELALLLGRQGRFAEAERLLLTITDRRPADPGGWFALAHLLENAGRDDEAARALCRALDLDGDIKVARFQLARLHVRGVAAARDWFARHEPTVLREALGGMINEAIAQLGFDEYRAIVAHARALFPGDDLFDAALQFGNVYDVDQTLASLQAEARRTGGRVAPAVITRARVGRRPRIAYVGNHLHRELQGGYIAHHDHDRFDFYLFSDDAIEKLVDPDPRLTVFRPKDVDLAEACRIAEIDLVVDIVGPYPREKLYRLHRTLLHRVAPLQCIWMNTFSTTGSPAYDFLIADRTLVRPGEESRFSERVLFMPHCHWFWTLPLGTFKPNDLPARRNGYVTFGSANRGLKLNDAVLTLWAQVMARLPGSRLRLISWHTDYWRLRRHIIEIFAAHGIAAGRLDFVPAMDFQELPTFYHSVDLCLDTFPFSGGLTTFEALWMGVPVVALAGDTLTGRQSESILHTLGRPDWIARDRAHFVDLACRLAQDVDALAAARAALRGEMLASPLCDGPGFARDLEARFAEMLAS